MNACPSREAIVHGVRSAAARDDAVALSALLGADVVGLTDGAGDVIAATVPLHGRDAVAAEILANLSGHGFDVTEQTVNAAPALVVVEAGRVVAILSFGIVDGLIRRVWITRSPLKLRRWNTPS